MMPEPQPLKGRFTSLVDCAALAGGYIAAGCLLATAVIISYEAFMRYSFDAPTIWVKEVAIYLCIATGFFAAAYALKQDSHFSITLVVDRLSLTNQRRLKAVTHSIGIVYSLIFVYMGAELAFFSYEMNDVSSGLLEVPLWIPQMLIPAGSLLLALQFASRFCKEVA